MNHDLHIHMILDGVDFRAAIAAHRPAPNDDLIRRCLEAYRQAGITFLRDGGDARGVCLRARELAPEYGITLLAPGGPIYKKGHYGAFLGNGWQTMADYRALLARAKAQRVDFIKLMLSGLMDFSRPGQLTEPPLDPQTIRELVQIAKGEGFAVMAHCNGAQAVKAAVMAGADSIEHGAYLDEECLHLLARSQTVWVPTLSPVGNLLGSGRFPDENLRQILEDTFAKLRQAAALGALIGCGSDAGAWRVPHGGKTEAQWLRQALGEGAEGLLQRAFGQIRRVFSE